MDQVQNYRAEFLPRHITCITGPQGSDYSVQCERLVRDYHYHHICLKNLIKREIEDPSSDDGKEFETQIRSGELIDNGLIVSLLTKEINHNVKTNKILIQGFPKTQQQANLFESRFGEIFQIVNISVPQEKVFQNIDQRGADRALSEEVISEQKRNYNNHYLTFIDTYSHLSVIQTIDGTQGADNIYKDIKNALRPNIIFFYGPPTVGKSEAAQILADKIKYFYINLTTFYLQNGVKSETDKVNKLMSFLSQLPYPNVIIDDFFSSLNQLNVFLNNFGSPYLVVHFDCPKDEVFNHIGKYVSTEKERKSKALQYQEFVSQRDQILGLLKKQSYFYNINANDTVPNNIKSILNKIKPLFIVSFLQHNQDLGYEYVQRLENERQFTFLDITEQADWEMDRGGILSKKLKSYQLSGTPYPPKFMVSLVSKIMFRNPKNKRFIVTNFPMQQNEFDSFELELFPIDFLVQFQRENQKYQYISHFSPSLRYFVQGKFIKIDRDALDILDSYITKRASYGFIVGPSCSGKTTIAQYIAKQFNYELINWEETETQLKEKLGGDDGPLETLTFQQITTYFKNKLNPNAGIRPIIFDGTFNYTQQQMNEWFKAVGLPSFVVELKVDDAFLTKRFRLKREIGGEDELSEEQKEEFSTNWHQFWVESAQKNFGINHSHVLANFSLDSTQKSINNVFQKRVFVVNDQLQESLEGIGSQEELVEGQKLMFMNICFKNEMTFVDVGDLLQKGFWQPGSAHESTVNQYNMRGTNMNPNFPSNYIPSLALQTVVNFLKQLPSQTRDVFLYGYPSADTLTKQRQSNDLNFPRPSDEIFGIEKELGPVRMVAVTTHESQPFRIEDQIWDLPKPEPKLKKKIVDDDGNEVDAPEEEEEKNDDDEDAKPKFNKFEHTWTITDGKPRTLAQWYNKLKITRKFYYSLWLNGHAQCFQQFQEVYLNLINEENQQNKEDNDFRKVNLFIQLCYSKIEYDEEPEELPKPDTPLLEKPEDKIEIEQNEGQQQQEAEQQQDQNENGEQQEEAQ